MKDIKDADIMVVKVVSGIKKTYDAVFKPFNELSFYNYKNGLLALRNNYKGTIWLDVILLHNINTTETEIKALDSFIKKINAQEVHMSLPTRPSGAFYKMFTSTSEEIERVSKGLGLKMDTQIFSGIPKNVPGKDAKEKIISIVTRRPCSIKELAKILFLDKETVHKAVSSIKGLEIVEADDEEWVIPRRKK